MRRTVYEILEIHSQTNYFEWVKNAVVVVSLFSRFITLIFEFRNLRHPRAHMYELCKVVENVSEISSLIRNRRLDRHRPAERTSALVEFQFFIPYTMWQWRRREDFEDGSFAEGGK